MRAIGSEPAPPPSRELAPDTPVCPDCGAPIDGSPICLNCGLDLRGIPVVTHREREQIVEVQRSAGRGVIKVMTIVGVIVVVAALAMFVWWLAAGKTGSGPGDNKEPPKLLPTPVGLVVPVPR
jgi:ribosomal protein L34E